MAFQSVNQDGAARPQAWRADAPALFTRRRRKQKK